MKLELTEDELTVLYVAILEANNKNIFQDQHEELIGLAFKIEETITKLMEQNKLL